MNQEQILRLAQKDPTLKAKLINILKGSEKKASRGDYDSAAFAAWAKMTNPQGMSENEAKAVLTSAGLTIKPPVEAEFKKVRKERKPLSQGMVVRVDKHNCNAKENQALCAKLHTNPENEIFYQIVRLNEPRDLRENCSFEISQLTLPQVKLALRDTLFVAFYHKEVQRNF
jgi:hypothetical protein